jgi:hypothetical protein
MRLFRSAMSAVVAGCLLPILAVLVATALASIGHCDLDEGSVHPCILLGHDFGGVLYPMFVSGWFGLMTLPVLAAALLLWIVVEIVHRLRRRHPS